MIVDHKAMYNWMEDLHMQNIIKWTINEHLSKHTTYLCSYCIPTQQNMYGTHYFYD
jgi:hypothetical protein